jgi:molybdate transport system substrate-binding protein
MRRVLGLWSLLILLTMSLPVDGASQPAARRLTVAAASDLEGAMDELLAGYRAANPTVAVTVTSGSSGALYSQLVNKAPFDVFLSADADFPRQLQAAGLGLADGPFDYAVGQLAAWAPKGSPLDFAKDGLAALASPQLHRLALANPRHAPYGRAAEAALRQSGLYEKLAGRLVFGENVAQAAQFARTGTTDACLVAYSLTLTPAMVAAGKAWIVPTAGPPLVQSGLILAWAKDPDAARAFRDRLRSPAGREVFTHHGYLMPGG